MLKNNSKVLPIGSKFGMLTVVELDATSMYVDNKPIQPNNWKYLCRCECGGTKLVTKGNLNRGHCKSCGCLPKSKKHNSIRIYKDYAKVFLRDKGGEFFLISLESVDFVRTHCWHNSGGYIVTNIKVGHRRYISKRLHRVLLGVDDPKILVDHIDGNSMNNKLSNLWVCSKAQNNRNRRISKKNSSGVHGVYWRSACNKWQAEICVNGKSKKLGMFIDLEDAREARIKAKVLYYGEFAPSKCRSMSEGPIFTNDYDWRRKCSKQKFEVIKDIRKFL